MTYPIWFALAAVLTAVTTAITLRFLIPVLISHKMGQKILDIGPRWHKNKEGTPTMGGVSFVLCGTVIFVILLLIGYKLFPEETSSILLPSVLTFAYALLNAAIGFIDDYTKFLKKQNEGLKAWQKYALQFVAALAYILPMKLLGFLTTAVYFPFFRVTLDLGFGYYVLAVLLLTGMSNAVNLTDGVDGLASSVTMVVAAFFAVCAIIMKHAGMSILSGCLLGGCIGFLVYNFHPARVFMGDTGSLFLGGMVGGLSFLMGNPLIMLLCGLVYVMETASVILQVGYFKLSHGKRIFACAPLHHHCEKAYGWSEVKIVTVAALLTLLCAVLSFFGTECAGML